MDGMLESIWESSSSSKTGTSSGGLSIISSRPARKSIASVVDERKRSFSTEQPQQQPRRSTLTTTSGEVRKSSITYAEYYLKNKRSGSLAVPVSQYSESQLKGDSNFII